MLCPEVLFFDVKSSKTSFDVSNDSKKVSISPDDIFDQLKVCIPGTVHTPDDLKQILTRDTQLYQVKKEFPFELLVDDQFVKTFVQEGKLFLQTFASSSDNDHFLCILPSGEQFIFLNAVFVLMLKSIVETFHYHNLQIMLG